MANEGFFHRLLGGGAFRVLTGYDLYISLILSWGLYAVVGRDIMEYRVSEFVSNATSLSGSLTAVIITGIAILVALTDTEFLILLKREEIYEKLMFTFEYTTLLSIFVSVFGIILQSYNFSYGESYFFVFSFLYLILAVSRLVSQIVSFGDRKGDVAIIQELEDITTELQEAKDSESHRETDKPSTSEESPESESSKA